MKMKKILKPAAVLAAAAFIVGASGCSDTSWSMKTNTSTLSNGNWIYYTYTSLNSALSKAEEESGESIDLKEKNPADIKVEGKSLIDWVNEDATKSCVAQLTIEKLVKDKKVVYSENDLKSISSNYEYYYNMGQAFYEKLGVSKETFSNVEARTQFLSDALFKKLYNEGGEKAVSDDELKKYFMENYTDYYFISYALTNADSEGEEQSIDDETKDTVKANFAKYAKMINEEGADTEKIEEQYKTDFKVESVTPTKNVNKLDNAGFSEDLTNAIKELDEKKATVKEIDNTMYLIYKGSISEDAEKISDDSSAEDSISRINILYGMKNDEFKEFLEAEQAKLKYEKNDNCISKYSVQRTIDIVKSE